MEQQRPARAVSRVRRFMTLTATLAFIAASTGSVLASSDLPPNWHVHDGQPGLGRRGVADDDRPPKLAVAARGREPSGLEDAI